MKSLLSKGDLNRSAFHIKNRPLSWGGILLIGCSLLLMACPIPFKPMIFEFNGQFTKKEIIIKRHDIELKIESSAQQYNEIDNVELVFKIKGNADIDSSYFVKNILIVCPIAEKPMVWFKEPDKFYFFSRAIERKLYDEMTLDEINLWLDSFVVYIDLSQVFNEPCKVIARVDKESRMKEFMRKYYKQNNH